MSKFNQLKSKLLSSNKCPKIKNEDTTIHISIDSTLQTLSPYTEDNKPIINSTFAEFLNNSVKDVSVKKDLTLEISSKNCDVEILGNAIKNYYYNEFVEYQRKLHFNMFASIITLIIGVLFLGLSILQYIANWQLLVGVIDILAWVFVWEGVDLFFFRRAELRYEQYRYMNFINAKIVLKND